MDIPLEIKNIYKILTPENMAPQIPLVFDSPHSGYIYPENFGYSCDLAMLRRAEDPHVEDLYGSVPRYGASLLMALFPRNYVDANRALDDIDEYLMDQTWPEPINPTQRSTAGHGLIHRLIKAGYPIYDRKLSLNEIQARIDDYYKPYHAALKTLIEDAVYKYGQVWHINCHSMSSLAARDFTAFGEEEADFVLGDRDGTSCNPEFTNSIKDFLSSLGYKVYLNNPYKGAEIVTRYSDPSLNRNSLQIEINKALYMNEVNFEKANNYNQFKDNIEKLVNFITCWVSQQNISMAAD